MRLFIKVPAVSTLLAVSISVAAAQNEVSLVSQGSSWKYLDNGSDQGTAWKEIGFNDSWWASGFAELGFGDNNETTVINKGPSGGQYRTYYFRRAFNVSAGQLNTLQGSDPFYQLFMRLKRDDGAVVYLNGEEIHRDNMPLGSINYLTLATSAAGGATESTFFETGIDGTGRLREGSNLLAVEVHQSSPSSSDISFDLNISAYNIPPTYGFYHPPQEITFEDAGIAETSFSPSLIFNNDLGWSSRDRNGAGGFLGGVANYEWYTFLPLADTGIGFAEGNCFAITNDWFELFNQINFVDLFADPLKYRIDLRNYVDCVVSIDVRTYDGGWPEAGIAPGNGFESGPDYIKFYSHTSLDGNVYTKKEELYITGGSGGGVEFIAEILVPEDKIKKVLIPAEDIGTAWIALNYNDADWLSAEKVNDAGQVVGGGIGYARNKPPGTDPFDAFIALDLEQEMSLSSSVYLRLPFEVEDKDLYSGLTLGARVDDGFVAYLNGNIVARFKAPAVPLWNSGATASNIDSIAITMTDYSLNNHLNKLVNGENILAIHALNLGRGSDFLFSCQLEGTTNAVAPRNDPPVNLNDLNRGINGSFYRYYFPIDSAVNSYAFTYEARCDEDIEAIFFDNFKIAGTPISVDSYESWIQLTTSYDLNDEGYFLEDPDADGLSNYLEYAFGGDAEVPGWTASSGQPLMPRGRVVEESGQLWFEMTWRQLNEPTGGTLDSPYGGFNLFDIKYIPQFSQDGINWDDAAPGADTYEQIGDAEFNNDGTVTITARYINPVNGTSWGFGRVKIENYKVILQ
ncbi:MAG: hypothetical protein VCA55_06005 [Verrucomicrobiales bacterium]